MCIHTCVEVTDTEALYLSAERYWISVSANCAGMAAPTCAVSSHRENVDGVALRLLPVGLVSLGR